MENKNKWVCPNDRELTLRARLETGWSVKSSKLQFGQNNEVINDVEQQEIIKVIQRSQQMEQKEKRRIGRMIDRLNNMKRNAKGDGKSKCALCNDEFGFFGTQSHCCRDCQKAVCNKCGVDSTVDKETFWLCKICSETREMWKKSGAWFFNALPKYEEGPSPSPSSVSINTNFSDDKCSNV